MHLRISRPTRALGLPSESAGAAAAAAAFAAVLFRPLSVPSEKASTLHPLRLFQVDAGNHFNNHNPAQTLPTKFGKEDGPICE